MKIRIKGNSLRLRLTQSEVTQFGESGVVSDSLHFPGSDSMQLTYTIERGASESINVDFAGNEIKLSVPEQLANNWTSTEQVGFEQKLPLNDGEQLLVLVEKDFQCLKPRANENEVDNFPNPLIGENC